MDFKGILTTMAIVVATIFILKQVKIKGEPFVK